MAKTSKTTRGQASQKDAPSEARSEIDRLGAMRLGELQALYAEVVGKPTRSPNRTFLVRSIIEAAAPVATGAPAAAEEVDAAEPQAAGAAGGQDESQGDQVTADAADPTSSPATGLAETVATPPANPETAEPKLSELDLPALQALLAEVTGRATRSTSRSYLVWKIRAAHRGRVPVGPRASRRQEGGKVMVLPLRMESGLVGQLDEAWRRLGHRNRMELFRAALGAYFESVGEREVALLFSAEE